MKKYEYKRVYISVKGLDATLKKYGLDGWCLVVSEKDIGRVGYHVVFMREIQQKRYIC